jgi:hypothetical protein
MAAALARRRAVRRVLRVADLGDPRICDHREQECRVRSRQVVVVDDPVEELAERLSRAPFQGVPETSVVIVSLVTRRGHSSDAGRSQGSALAVTRAPTSGGPTISPSPISALQSPK